MALSSEGDRNRSPVGDKLAETTSCIPKCWVQEDGPVFICGYLGATAAIGLGARAAIAAFIAAGESKVIRQVDGLSSSETDIELKYLPMDKAHSRHKMIDRSADERDE